MSQSIVSYVYLNENRLDIVALLKHFSDEGWAAYGRGLPLIYSISESDLTEELVAHSHDEIQQGIALVQSRLDNQRQALISLANECQGTISIAFQFDVQGMVVSCHYACKIPLRDESRVDLNSFSDLLLLPVDKAGLVVRKFLLTISR